VKIAYLTLHNDFHNTRVDLLAKVHEENGNQVMEWTYRLSPAQVAKANKALCGMRDCTCGGIRNGIHELDFWKPRQKFCPPSSGYKVDLIFDEQPDGGMLFKRNNR
jgi:hypothetical protein